MPCDFGILTYYSSGLNFRRKILLVHFATKNVHGPARRRFAFFATKKTSHYRSLERSPEANSGS